MLGAIRNRDSPKVAVLVVFVEEVDVIARLVASVLLWCLRIERQEVDERAVG
jgi:hypothetical protein